MSSSLFHAGLSGAVFFLSPLTMDMKYKETGLTGE